MKRIILLVIAFVTFYNIVHVYAADDIKIKINGNLVSLPDQQPKIINNRVYVPLGSVLEKMGISTVRRTPNKDYPYEQVSTQQGPLVLNIILEEEYSNICLMTYSYKVNDVLVPFSETFTIESRPLIDSVSKRALVPVRFISELYGAAVDWDEKNKTVIINCNTSDVNFYGNTIANSLNGGIAATEGNFIYYCDGNGYLYSMNQAGKERKKLMVYCGKSNPNLNIVKGWLFYSNDDGVILKTNVNDDNKSEEVFNYRFYNANISTEEVKVVQMMVVGDFILALYEEKIDDSLNYSLMKISVDNSFSPIKIDTGKNIESFGLFGYNLIIYKKEISEKGETVTDINTKFIGHYDSISDTTAIPNLNYEKLAIENYWIFGSIEDKKPNYGFYQMRMDGSLKAKIANGSIKKFNVHNELIFFVDPSDKQIRKVNLKGSQNDSIIYDVSRKYNKAVGNVCIVGDFIIHGFEKDNERRILNIGKIKNIIGKQIIYEEDGLIINDSL